MRKRHSGERRPGDLIGRVLTVAKIATGELVEFSIQNRERQKAAKWAIEPAPKKLTREERREIAKTAAIAR